MKYKIICTDIDGTLLDHRRELSDFTLATFKKLPLDVAVVLASSRMPSAMTHLQAELGITDDPLICYNGGYVIRYTAPGTTPQVFYSTWIDVAVCEAIVALCDNTDIHVSLYFEDEWYAPRWDYWSEREARITKVNPLILPTNQVLSNWKSRNIGGHKVMCMGPESEIDSLERQLNETFSADIHVYRSRPTYLELAPRAISKGSALRLLLEKKYDVLMEAVMAFGDNYNDIELLKVAGKGIAVSDARAEVIAAADEITLTGKEDGVAIAVARYFL